MLNQCSIFINVGTVILLYLLYYILSFLSKRCKCYLRNPANERGLESTWPGALSFMIFQQLCQDRRCKGQDQHQRKAVRDVATTFNYNHHHSTMQQSLKLAHKFLTKTLMQVAVTHTHTLFFLKLNHYNQHYVVTKTEESKYWCSACLICQK